MSKIAVAMADGVEEIEGLTVVDLCRRAGIEVTMVSVSGNLTVHGSHGIDFKADALFEETDWDGFDMLVLPGGKVGTDNLEAHAGLMKILDSYAAAGKMVAAICAAPSVLGHRGILRGRKATCHPGFEKDLLGAEWLAEPVVCDGNLITSRGVGTAIAFALAITEHFCGAAKAREIADAIVYEE